MPSQRSQRRGSLNHRPTASTMTQKPTSEAGQAMAVLDQETQAAVRASEISEQMPGVASARPGSAMPTLHAWSPRRRGATAAAWRTTVSTAQQCSQRGGSRQWSVVESCLASCHAIHRLCVLELAPRSCNAGSRA